MHPHPPVRALLSAASLLLAAPLSVRAATAQCPTAGLSLPAGFCASVFAQGLGRARHLAVATNGVVYVNTWRDQDYEKGPLAAGGFIVALRDTKGTGTADVVERFGPPAAKGGHGGTGIALYQDAVYAEETDRIERYRLRAPDIVPREPPQVIVSGLPLGGDHPMRPFVIDADGQLYVDVASATNSCQERNRQRRSPGINPCTELNTRGGIWRFDANRSGQKFAPAARYATGIRNAEGLAVDVSGHGIWSTQHGRDQLHQNWPALYRPEEEATQPAEELLRIREGGDYGWPTCYFDEVQNKLVLAPEYGGDGGKAVGVCAGKLAPVASFPAHWAPNDLTLYTGSSFPSHYRGGAFVAFHGSWDRAPYPQGGYNIVFVGLADGHAAGRCEIFADGFAGAVKQPKGAAHRPAGVAVGPDGALYVADDVAGSVYRIVYRGGVAPPPVTPCPPPDAPAGSVGGANAAPPEGVHPDAGRAAAPTNVVDEKVSFGAQVFHGQAGGAACVGCHGNDGSGSPQGPDLTSGKWHLSEGRLAGIRQVIEHGVQPSAQYPNGMPPMGGGHLTPEQIEAVTNYVYTLGHHQEN